MSYFGGLKAVSGSAILCKIFKKITFYSEGIAGKYAFRIDVRIEKALPLQARLH